jgi:hypothetical protein
MYARCCWLTFKLVATIVVAVSVAAIHLFDAIYSQQCVLAFVGFHLQRPKIWRVVVRARNGPGRGTEGLAKALAAEEIGSTTTFI